MHQVCGPRAIVLILAALAAVAAPSVAAPPPPGPEERALAYLGREVPRWSRENRCFSCHNNGDAARALYDAARLGRPVPAGALDDTDGWLARPAGWDRNGGDGPFSDKRLARVQFASALASAVQAGRVRDRGPLLRAAGRLAEDQAADGSWPLDGGDSAGSPATYGRPLLTLGALETLRAADPARHRDAIEHGRRWLLRQPASNIPDASAILIASTLGPLPDGVGAEPGRRPLELLRRAQSDDGGWGPYADSPPEVFDTAVALLALARLDPSPPDVPRRVARGRAFLIGQQNPDGSWAETTRPTGGESYAQRLSTTGWATLALLKTRRRDLPAQHGPRR